jgi:hypothetical protein
MDEQGLALADTFVPVDFSLDGGLAVVGTW